MTRLTKLMNNRSSEISTMSSAAAGTDDAVAILKRDSAELDAFFRKVLSAPSDAPRKLLEAIEYSLMAGGKRLRPALVMESFRACGGKNSRDGSALSAAAPTQLVHTFSLVHHDLPALDDDEFRRGRPP